MVVRVALTLALAAGCRSNCEPSISGGTGSQRAEVDDSISHFLSLLRPGLDVCVPEVEIVPDLEDAHGTYTAWTRRIVLKPDFGALFHEMCHAVDYQNDLSVDVYQPAPGTTWDIMYDGDPHEVFASFCALGPRSSVFLDEACAGDPAGLDLYRETAADLFVDIDDEFVDTDVMPELAPMVAIETASDAFVLSTAPTGVVIALADRTVALDPWTGNEIAMPSDARRAGDDAETWLGVAQKIVYETVDGEFGSRWLLWRERVTSLGCGDPNHQVFAYDDWLWSARLEDGMFTIGLWMME